MSNQEKIGAEEEEAIITVEQAEKDDPFAKGRERMAAIGGFFSKAKERISNAANKVGSSMSRFWTRTKTFGGEAIAATLSVDELAKQGAQYTGDKIAQGDRWVGDKVEEAGAYIGEKGAQATTWVGDKFEQGYDWSQEKADQMGNFVEENWDKAKQFTQHKAEQVKNFAVEKTELVKDVAFFVKEKTAQGLHKAKEGIANRWGKMKAFGEGAIESGKLGVTKLKENYRSTVNMIRENRLRADYEEALAKESAAAEKVEKCKQKREALEQKMGLLQGLQAAA